MIGVYTPNSPFYDKDRLKTRVGNNAHAQGVGRHTDEEVGRMIEHDLTMLSEILGEGLLFKIVLCVINGVIHFLEINGLNGMNE